MSGVTTLLKDLRAVGVSIRVEAGRLIVEAPTGTVTAEMRARLVRRKTELVSALETDPICSLNKDTITAERFREVADLLAVAYQRYARVQRVPVDQARDSVLQQLALSEHESVHGHGPVP